MLRQGKLSGNTDNSKYQPKFPYLLNLMEQTHVSMHPNSKPFSYSMFQIWGGYPSQNIFWLLFDQTSERQKEFLPLLPWFIEIR